ncbi:hypothetical protein Lal_00000375 [Lupinus albus]|nr:hypothetical protein Lal_00000375 [Lupinus albus]
MPHISFCILAQKSENPTSFWEGGTYLNLYMQETLSLLDLLNLINLAISAMLRHRLIAEFTAQKVDQEVSDQFPQLKSISISLQNIVYVISHRLHKIQDHSMPVLVSIKWLRR